MHDNLRHYFKKKKEYADVVLSALYSEFLDTIENNPQAFLRCFNTGSSVSNSPDNMNKMKERMRDEHDFSIENSVHLITLESALIGVLSYQKMEHDEIDRALESIGTMIKAFRADREGYRSFMMDMAKQAVSDTYYLFLLYSKYYLNTDLSYENMELLLQHISRRLEEYTETMQVINILTKYKKHVDKLFFTTNQKIPWEYDDYRMREFYTVNQGDKILSTVVMSKILEKALTLKDVLKKDYQFLSKYYNTDNGKSFRYRFIVHSMTNKVNSGKISDKIYHTFLEVTSAYQSLYDTFTSNGIGRFGGEMTMDYADVLEFSYKASKLIEYKYLRSSRYEKLDDFRSDVLLPLEKEIVHNVT